MDFVSTERQKFKDWVRGLPHVSNSSSSCPCSRILLCADTCSLHQSGTHVWGQVSHFSLLKILVRSKFLEGTPACDTLCLVLYFLLLIVTRGKNPWVLRSWAKASCRTMRVGFKMETSFILSRASHRFLTLVYSSVCLKPKSVVIPNENGTTEINLIHHEKYIACFISWYIPVSKGLNGDNCFQCLWYYLASRITPNSKFWHTKRCFFRAMIENTWIFSCTLQTLLGIKQVQYWVYTSKLLLQ